MTEHFSAIERQFIEAPDNVNMQVITPPNAEVMRVLEARIKRIVVSENEKKRKVLVMTRSETEAKFLTELYRGYKPFGQWVQFRSLFDIAESYVRNNSHYLGLDFKIEVVLDNKERAQVWQRSLLRTGSDLSTFLGIDPSRQSLEVEIHRLFTCFAAIKSANLSEREVRLTYDDPTLWSKFMSYQHALEQGRLLDREDVYKKAILLANTHPLFSYFYKSRDAHVFVLDAQELADDEYLLLKTLHTLSPELTNTLTMIGHKHPSQITSTSANYFLDVFPKAFEAVTFTFDESFETSQSILKASANFKPELRQIASPKIKGELKIYAYEDEESEVKSIVAALVRLEETLDNESPTPYHIAVLARHPSSLMRLKAALPESLYAKVAPYNRVLRPVTPIGKALLYGVLVKATPQNTRDMKVLVDTFEVDATCDTLDSLAKVLLKSFDSLASIAGDVLQAIDTVDINEPDLDEILERAILKLMKEGKSSCSTKPIRFAIAQALDDLEAFKVLWEKFKAEPYFKRLDEFKHYLFSDVNLNGTTYGKILLSTIPVRTPYKCDHVFMMGLTEGQCPSYLAQDSNAIAEERQYLLDGMLMARRNLYLSYPKTRQMPWGEVVEEEPSRFLTLIQQAKPNDD